MCVLASEPAVHRPFVPARDIIVTRREIAAIVPAAVPSIAGWACLLGEVAAGQIGAVARHLAVLALATARLASVVGVSAARFAALDHFLAAIGPYEQQMRAIELPHGGSRGDVKYTGRGRAAAQEARFEGGLEEEERRAQHVCWLKQATI